MFFLSQNGTQLVSSEHLYILDSAVYAVIRDGEDVKLAEYEIYGEAQEALRRVYSAIEDSEAVFSFE